MAEWSKAPANAPREQGVVGSKPAPADNIVFALFRSLFDHSALVMLHMTVITLALVLWKYP